MEIRGKTALVLGATRGIGRAIALSLLDAGARVIATGYDWPEDIRSLRQTLAASSPRHLLIEIDLRDPVAIAGLFHRIDTECGGLDILINNIERGGMPVVHGAYNESQWDLEMDTTFKAKWWMVRHAMPLLKKAPDGVIVTLSSIAAIVGRSGPAGMIFNDGYAAANRAVSSFTETWAREGAPSVRVNELMLGFFETRHAEHTRGWSLLSTQERQAILDTCLLSRSGRLEEAVRAALFLIRDATYMTGAVLRLDGGYVLGGNTIAPLPTGVE